MLLGPEFNSFRRRKQRNRDATHQRPEKYTLTRYDSTKRYFCVVFILHYTCTSTFVIDERSINAYDIIL